MSTATDTYTPAFNHGYGEAVLEERRSGREVVGETANLMVNIHLKSGRPLTAKESGYIAYARELNEGQDAL